MEFRYFGSKHIESVAIYYDGNELYRTDLYELLTLGLVKGYIEPKRMDEEQHSLDQRKAYKVLIEKARAYRHRDKELMAWCDEQWKLHKLDELTAKNKEV